MKTINHNSLERQREYRKRNGNACTKKYEKTKKGFVMRMYRNMKSRISGVQKKKSHLYFGLALLEKDEFYKWILSSKTFHELFENYEKEGFNRKLAPTVDRIDSSRGYEMGNIEIVTHSENSKRGSISKHRGLKVENTSS